MTNADSRTKMLAVPSFQSLALSVRQDPGSVIKLFWIIYVMQYLVVLVLYFGDIGFDKPGRFGLDFEHFLFLMLLQGCLSGGAVIVVFLRRQWKYLGVQLILLIVTAVGVLSN